MRPPLSVVGTRCTLCTPDSYFSLAKTLSPPIRIVASLTPPSSVSCSSITSQRQPRASAYR